MASLRFPRVLITGANGSLARAIARYAPDGTECVALPRTALDICNDSSVAHVLREVQPNLVINGAAYNLVDRAETDGAEDALRINALGPAKLAAGCREANVPLVHFSTDFVFDGHKKTPYGESDAARPLGVYGASKLAGENIVLATGEQNWAIRVCRLFGPIPDNLKTQKPAGNFPLLMIKLARERGRVRVVNDQIGTPSYTPDLARAVWQLVENSQGGLFQLSNAGEVAFDEYARETLRLAGVPAEVESVSSEEYGAPAKRPLYSTMSNDKAHNFSVTPLRDWRDALREFLSR
ncbi:MAG TPA: dTDP-4-dehydrorhamnose reductase [Abditibacteriaceae bacterium]|jgi:dTDP-4-dehydrorhamnose reductase